jgi:hypothetical protein
VLLLLVVERLLLELAPLVAGLHGAQHAATAREYEKCGRAVKETGAVN